MNRNLTAVLGVFATLTLFIWVGCSDDRSVNPQLTSDEAIDLGRGAELAIGPIDGLTTAWHPMPKQVVVPRDVEFVVRLNVGGDASVTWDGATETNRTPSEAFAKFEARTPGDARITVRVTAPDNGAITRKPTTYTFDVAVLDVDLASVSVGTIEPRVEPMTPDEGAANGDVMPYLFEASVSDLDNVGPGAYLTSVDREIKFSAEITPRAIAPMIEWRIDGKARFLGETASRFLGEPGDHHIAAGPPARENPIKVTAYDVTIFGPEEDIPLGEPIAFTAITTPNGFESHVRWVAGTIYGSTTRTVGKGANFSVQFDDAQSGDGWCYGVRANNSVTLVDIPPTTPRCIYQIICVTQSIACVQGDCDFLVLGGPTFAYAMTSNCNLLGACILTGGQGCAQATVRCPANPNGRCKVKMVLWDCRVPVPGDVLIYVGPTYAPTDCNGFACFNP